MDLKSLLKTLKLNESQISTFLGAVVILVAALFLINYFKGKGVTLPGLSTNENQTSETQTTKNSHIVTKGENLWKIAVSEYKDGYKWVDIAKANNLTNADKLAIGQELTLPDLSQAVSSEKLNTATVISGGSYSVVKGDSLWKISVRAYGDGYKWVQIARENKLKNPNLIHPGNEMILPR